VRKTKLEIITNITFSGKIDDTASYASSRACSWQKLLLSNFLSTLFRPAYLAVSSEDALDCGGTSSEFIKNELQVLIPGLGSIPGTGRMTKKLIKDDNLGG